MLTQEKASAQISASNLQPGVINPSRSITSYDEAYLRDYTLAAQVISWDEGVFGTTLQVTAADITNICIAGDTVWYQINYYRGIPLNIEIFHAHRQRIQLYKDQLDAQEECQPQDEFVGFAGDSVSCQLQPTQEALTEFEQGRCHGQQDAAAGLHPMYTQAVCQYSAGYVEGYKSLYPPQQAVPIPPAEWSVSFNSRWRWYEAWVGDRCIGQASTHEEAERKAQRYIAVNDMIRRQNAAVMTAYSC